MRSSILCVTFTMLLSLPAGGKTEVLPYRNALLPIEQRVSDLLSRMTLEEKILQLNQDYVGTNDNQNNHLTDAVNRNDPRSGSYIYGNEDPTLANALQHKAMETRLGIPILFGHDVIHGFRAVYPIPLAISCSWNPQLAGEACAMAAREARAAGVRWTFSPMIDVSRDPRWGRIAECFGEDPYTNSVFCVAAVKGYQGDGSGESINVASCLKHFVGYGASEAGRDYVYTEISKQTLWDTYLPPYEAGVKAGVATLMSAFNCISGIPASSNHYTLTEVLKNRWKHDGFVVSDWAAVQQLMNQGTAADKKEATRQAFTAGVEMDMCDNLYVENMKQLVDEGKVSEAQIDEAVRRVLRIKMRLGLFEKPYAPELGKNGPFMQAPDLLTAQRLAEESFVLLKNNGGILPLSKDRKIALIGPLADNQGDLLGSWSGHGHSKDVISILSGLKERRGAQNVAYAKGCDLQGMDTTSFAAAEETARKADIVVLCLGESRGWSGENASRASISLQPVQERLFDAVARTGKPIVLLLSNGRPLDLSRLVERSGAILEIWQPGVMAGRAVANALDGTVNPSGKLSVTFPRNVGQIPIYYNRRHPARVGTQGHYQDLSIEPLFCFGEGLSYTTFTTGSLTASTTSVRKGDKLTLQIDVTNGGNVDGAETALWYVAAESCPIARPMKELKFFEKQVLKKGETKTYKWQIDPLRDLGYVNDEGEHFLSPGKYTLSVFDKSVTIEVTL